MCALWSCVRVQLMETRRTFRDDGFLAAVKLLQAYIDQDPDREVSVLSFF